MSPDPAENSATPRWNWKRLVMGRRPKVTLIRATAMVVLAVVVFKYVLIPVRIDGDSMQPTYRNGSVNFINQLAFRSHPPRRGDVVGVRYAGKSIMLLKRIVGLPGEEVAIVKGKVIINGHPLDEPYVKDPSPWQVPPRRLATNEYLVIGDNRSMVQSQHLFGAAQADRIVGKVLW
jgi:signal peptidase I